MVLIHILYTEQLLTRLKALFSKTYVSVTLLMFYKKILRPNVVSRMYLYRVT